MLVITIAPHVVVGGGRGGVLVQADRVPVSADLFVVA